MSTNPHVAICADVTCCECGCKFMVVWEGKKVILIHDKVEYCKFSGMTYRAPEVKLEKVVS